ncbi:MAG: 50S ribosomal protein L4 [Opitutales bacterium]
MKLKIFTTDGGSAAEKEVPGFPEFEGDKGVLALRQVVLAYQANKRQGNASTKTRSEVRGTGKKPFRQKGTGTARQGTRQAPQHYHGGVAFGPKPRDYSQKINKKVRNLALRRALYERAVDGSLALIEDWNVAEPKTKLFDQLLSRVAPEGRVLAVADAFEDKEALAGRNIPRLTLTRSASLNSFDLVKYDRIIVSEKGIDTVIARMNGGSAQ